MRALVLLLVAANLLFFALARDGLAPFVTLSTAYEREPERLAQQIDPASLRIVPAPPAGAAAGAASGAAP
jgi:hypothetical protein